MGAPSSLARRRSPLFGARRGLRRCRPRRDGDLHRRADARSSKRRARRPAAQCHRARPRRQRACRAGLAPGAYAAQRAAALPGASRARDRGSPLLRPFRRRSARARPRLVPQCRLRRRGRGRLDHHATARQEPVSHPEAHPLAQARRGGLCGVARAALLQGRDPRTLSQPRLFRRRHLRGRGRIAPLFRQVVALRDAASSGALGRTSEGAFPLRADAEREARQRPRR